MPLPFWNKQPEKSPPPAPPRTKELIATWHEQLIASDKTKRFVLTTLTTACTYREIADLTDMGLKALRDELMKSVKPSTQQKRLAAMRLFLLWCVAQQVTSPRLTVAQIQEHFRPVSVPHPPPAPGNATEVLQILERLVATAPDGRSCALVVATLISGWPCAEVVQLDVGDVDLAAQTLRGLHVPTVALDAFRDLIAQRAPADPLFVSTHRQRLSASQAGRLLADLSHQVDLPIALGRWVRRQTATMHGLVLT